MYGTDNPLRGIKIITVPLVILFQFDGSRKSNIYTKGKWYTLLSLLLACVNIDVVENNEWILSREPTPVATCLRE